MSFSYLIRLYTIFTFFLYYFLNNTDIEGCWLQYAINFGTYILLSTSLGVYNTGKCITIYYSATLLKILINFQFISPAFYFIYPAIISIQLRYFADLILCQTIEQNGNLFLIFIFILNERTMDCRLVSTPLRFAENFINEIHSQM